MMPNIIKLHPDGVDMVTPLPDTDKKKILPTLQNFEEVIRRCGADIRQNIIKKRIEISVPGETFVLDNYENATYERLMGWCASFKMPRDTPSSYLNVIAGRNPYNPVVVWIKSKPWDSVSRLQQLYDTVQASDNTLKEILIYRWLLSAVAAAFNPNGVSASGVLTFQGTQNMGKTKWFKKLVPEDLDAIKDGMTLNPSDKDSVMRVVSYWLVELGEVDATFRKADLAVLKSFITMDRDVLRLPYARQISTFPRRTVFFASVNEKEYLHDKTGNRRWWTVECESINHNHDIDMQQLWAEIYADYENGEKWHLEEGEFALLQSYNENFETIDTIKERILSYYDWDAPRVAWKTATDVLMECGFKEPKNPQACQASTIIKNLNNNDKKEEKKSGPKRLLHIPARKDPFYPLTNEGF